MQFDRRAFIGHCAGLTLGAAIPLSSALAAAQYPDKTVRIQLHKWPHFTFFTLESVAGAQFGIPRLQIVNPTACQVDGL